MKHEYEFEFSGTFVRTGRIEVEAEPYTEEEYEAVYEAAYNKFIEENGEGMEINTNDANFWRIEYGTYKKVWE